MLRKKAKDERMRLSHMIRSDCLQSKLKRLFCQSIRAFTMRTTLNKALKDMCDIEADLRRRRKEKKTVAVVIHQMIWTLRWNWKCCVETDKESGKLISKWERPGKEESERTSVRDGEKAKKYIWKHLIGFSHLIVFVFIDVFSALHTRNFRSILSA